MNLKNAYKILELSEGSSKDEIKAAFKKLAKRWHPDKNPNDPTAEAKFKEINAAHELLQNPPPEMSGFSGFSESSFQDMAEMFINLNHFGNVSNQRRTRPTPICNVEINFSESVLGCEKTLEFDRYVKCNDCSGSGTHMTVDKCKHCNGAGVKASVFSRGNVQFSQTCTNCFGSGKLSKECQTCVGYGTIASHSSFKVQLPGGIENGQNIRLAGAGNFVQTDGHRDFFDNAYIKVKVIADSIMALEGQNVISKIKISLLEALRGTKKEVNTVKGNVEIDVRKGIRNNDEIILKNYGVNNKGNHVFMVDVEYPENVDELIKYLEK
jgi:molecular chaperone DnaJ